MDASSSWEACSGRALGAQRRQRRGWQQGLSWAQGIQQPQVLPFSAPWMDISETGCQNRAEGREEEGEGKGVVV